MVIVKHITLVHNPTAGDEAHDKKHLKKLLDENGYDCRYASTKESDWKDDVDRDDTDLFLVAGGDGTVRKVAKRLLQRKLIDKLPPMALLPMGTANNIAKTVCAHEDAEDIVAALADAQPMPFDVGRINNVPDHEFFIESFGYGVFPYLMMEADKRKVEHDDPVEELKIARELLLELTKAYDAKDCKLTIDGEDYSGKYIMLEVMNIKSIGPNLFLAPHAEAGDGLFDVVLIPEEDKPMFIDYVTQKISGVETTQQFKTVQGRKISIRWEGTHVHADDEVVKLSENALVEVEMKAGVLEFLLPRV